MTLHKFQHQVAMKDGARIRARDLDNNFAKLIPQAGDGYQINESSSGYKIVAPSFEPPPSGKAGWRAVQRCDGAIMYVWGTVWTGGTE